MDLMNYSTHIPAIEKEIVDNKLDTLVMGLGPTGRLLPWIDRKILLKLRLWSSHDFHRIMPVDDLVMFDTPGISPRLKLGSESFDICLKSRPKRLWLYRNNAKHWQSHLHYSMESVTTVVPFHVWHKQNPKKLKIDLEAEEPHCGWVSPLGCATLAWREGCRRIGVLGVEMGPDHMTHQFVPFVDEAFVQAADQAHARGGVVKNLSPTTFLRRFREWKPSTSSSEPTDTSASTGPKTSSNTASASTPPAPSESTGCEQATRSGQSAATETVEAGRSAQA